MKHQVGFTLIELMVTLAILAIVLTLAIPNLSTFIQNNRISSQASNILASMKFARSEAVKRDERVTICKSSNSTSCDSDATWDNGWIIFVDSDDNGVRDTATEALLRVQNKFSSASLDGTGQIENYISFAGNGFATQALGTSTQSGTLVLCDQRGYSSNARAIILSTTGNVMSVKATDYRVEASIRTDKNCTVA